MNLVRMEQLMSGELSGSQLDLVMHGPGEPTAPGHSLQNQHANVNCAFLMSELRDNSKLATKGPASF